MVIGAQSRIDQAGQPNIDVVERESPTHRVLLLGDALDCLGAMKDVPEVDVAGHLTVAENGYSAAVIGVELRGDYDPAVVKDELNRRVDECMLLARRVPSLHHIILVLDATDLPDRLPRGVTKNLLSTCDSISQTIQAEVEQRFGSYVIVTIIVANRCNDFELLAERVLDRATQTEVADATAVVLWDEILGDSIGDVGLNQYI